MSIKRKFYRFLLGAGNAFKKFDFVPPPVITETQELAIKIFEKSLLKPDVELLMAPLSLTYYIHSDDIFIIMDGTDLKIINGKYEYHISLNEKIHNKLSMKFKRVLENKRKRMEQEMLSNTRRSLQNILQDLS
jgi:hypothetical protein